MFKNTTQHLRSFAGGHRPQTLDKMINERTLISLVRILSADMLCEALLSQRFDHRGKQEAYQ